MQVKKNKSPTVAVQGCAGRLSADDDERTVGMRIDPLEVDEVPVIVLILSDDQTIASASCLRCSKVDVYGLTGILRSEVESELMATSSSRTDA